MAQNDMLSSILNDPEKLQSAISMASSLLGGASGDMGGPSEDMPPMDHLAPPSQPAMSMPQQRGMGSMGGMGGMGSMGGGTYDPSAELMQRAMPVIAEIARSGQNAVSREKLNLLNAVKPFVADNVGTQIDHGLRLVSLARMARSAMKQFGEAQTQDGGGVTHV